MKNKIMDERDFQVSSVTTVATEDRADAEFLEEWLNQTFRLSRYGLGLEQIFIIFTVKDAPGAGHYQFHPEESLLELILPLPEAELKQAGSEAVIRLMREAVVAQFRAIPDRVIPHFDLPALIGDLEGA